MGLDLIVGNPDPFFIILYESDSLKRLNITVNILDVTLQKSCQGADSHGAVFLEHPEKIPSPGGERLKKGFHRIEGDELPLGFSRFP